MCIHKYIYNTFNEIFITIKFQTWRRQENKYIHENGPFFVVGSGFVFCAACRHNIFEQIFTNLSQICTLVNIILKSFAIKSFNAPIRQNFKPLVQKTKR